MTNQIKKIKEQLKKAVFDKIDTDEDIHVQSLDVAADRNRLKRILAQCFE